MRLPCLTFLTVVVATALAAPVSAQASSADAPVEAATPAAPSVAERLALPPDAGLLLAPALDGRDADAPADAVLPAQSTGRGTALAIVGGALFVGGLIAGGDAGTLMVIAGAGIGAYGLYIMLSP